jgi:hypothetical protein
VHEFQWMRPKAERKRKRVIVRRFIFGVLLAATAAVITAGVLAQATHRQTATSNTSRDAAWVRAFAATGQLSTTGVGIGRENQLNWDPRFTSLLAASFPQKQWFWYDHWKLTPLPAVMQLFMGVPGNAVLVDGRFVTLDGCVPHDCGTNRGMLWIDTGTDPAVLIFAGINTISSNSSPFKSHLWVYTSEKLNWQKVPPSFLFSLNRWLATIGENGYFGTDGYRYDFSLATIVQPNGVMTDLGPNVFGLDVTESHTTPGAGL